MDVLQKFVDAYIRFVGSKKQFREATREILEKMISYEEHVLTTDQQAQARENIGIGTLYKCGNKTAYTKGTYDVYFDIPFTGTYAVFPSGSTGSMAVTVIVVDDSELDHFTMKVTADCTVRWIAYLVTEP